MVRVDLDLAVSSLLALSLFEPVGLLALSLSPVAGSIGLAIGPKAFSTLCHSFFFMMRMAASVCIALTLSSLEAGSEASEIDFVVGDDRHV
jgi:hypothetical protein